MNYYLKKRSIMQGLIIPEEEGLEVYKCSKEPASLHEMELAKKPHRWPEMRKLQSQFFNAFMDKAEYYESEIFNVLNLPTLDEVRAEETKSTKAFTYNEDQLDAVDVLLVAWIASLISERDSDYNFYQLSAFSIGLSRTYNQIVRSIDDQYVPILASRRLLASYENPYLQGIIKDGGKLIKEALGKKWWSRVRGQLERMAREGRSPMEVARWLHRNARFEGQAWYWLRLARTESIFALDVAFNAQSKALGARFEEWSTGANPCQICSDLDGMVWKLGEGPEPGYDTHPSCLCLRIALFGTDSPIQEAWEG